MVLYFENFSVAGRQLEFKSPRLLKKLEVIGEGRGAANEINEKSA